MSWSRELNTTITKHIRNVEVNILRNRKVLAMMQSRGRITMNHSGTDMDWPVKYKRAPIQGYAEADVLTFARRDRWKKAILGWRGYAATDAMTKLERLKNKSVEAIVKVYEQIVPSLLEDIEDNFGDEIYIDGNASGNGNRIHGMESLFGTSGAAAAGFIAAPSDTYAGLATDLGNYGGNWSTNGSSQVEWPTGTGDAHYDFWSPLIVDYTDTAWEASVKTWANTCKEALRYGIIKGKKNKSAKSMTQLILLNDELYRQFLNSLDGQERLEVTRAGATAKGGLYSLGFTDVVNFDGCDISSEYGIPTTVGYGFAFEHMELCSLQGQMFVPEGPDWDIATQTWRFSIDFFGNLKMNPRYQLKFDNVTP